jgi:hypothetical protein
VSALHGRGDAQQVVPHRGDQVGVEEAGQQRPAPRVPVGELGARPGPVQGDLPLVPDPRGELPADEVEQCEVGQGGAGGVGGVLGDRQVGLVAEDPVEYVVRLRRGGHDDLRVERGVLVGHVRVRADPLAAGEVAGQVPGGDGLAFHREPLPVRGRQGAGAERLGDQILENITGYLQRISNSGH